MNGLIYVRNSINIFHDISHFAYTIRNMRKVLVSLIIITLLFAIVHANELFEEQSEDMQKESKPAYCLELSCLSSTMNIFKDNVCLGFASGLPLAIMLVVGIVALIVWIIIAVIIAIGGGDTSNMGEGAIITLITITGLSFIGGILVNILAPYWDYDKQEKHRMWESPAVIAERIAGWGLAIGLSALVIWNFTKNNDGN